MKNKEKYIRVGTSLYKLVRRPLISGDYVEEKVPWSYETCRKWRSTTASASSPTM